MRIHGGWLMAAAWFLFVATQHYDKEGWGAALGVFFFSVTATLCGWRAFPDPNKEATDADAS